MSSWKNLPLNTAWKVFKYGVFSGPYFPVFELNTGKYGPEKTQYLDTFHTVRSIQDTEHIDVSRGNITKKVWELLSNGCLWSLYALDKLSQEKTTSLYQSYSEEENYNPLRFLLILVYIYFLLMWFE